MSFPPKGSLNTSPRQLIITIVSIQYQVNPRNILMIIKLIQILQKKSRILNIKIENSQSSLVFGSTNFLPCYKSSTSSLNIRSFLSPQALPHIFNQLLLDSDREIALLFLLWVIYRSK